jgi:hypothetical protein
MEAVVNGKARRLPALLRWHGRLGVIACCGVLLWALSGLLHPVMSSLQPRAVTFAPPPAVFDLRNLPSPAALLRQHGIARIETFRLVALPSGHHFQVSLPGQAEPAYFRLADGARVPDADRSYAEHLARHYLGDQQSALADIRRIDRFDGEYSYINRYLPAYRVAFARDDAMRVYVDTATSRLGTLVDRSKSWFVTFFQALHTWSFLDGAPWLRAVLMSIFLSAAFLTALAGLWIYGLRFAASARPAGLRRAHRTTGILVSITTLTFTFSGAYHLLHGLKAPLASPGLRAAVFDATAFSLPLSAVPALLPAGAAVRAIAPAQVNGRTYYRVEIMPSASAAQVHGDAHHAPAAPAPAAGPAKAPAPAPAPLLVDAADGRVLEDGEAHYVRSLARVFSGLGDEAIRATAAISKFEGEYGFVFKRLPVTRVEYEAPDSPRYYVDSANGVLSARIDDGDAREGWSFAYLHKFEWLGVFGKLTRDGIAMAFALGNAIVAVLGCVLFLRRRAATDFRRGRSP